MPFFLLFFHLTCLGARIPNNVQHALQRSTDPSPTLVEVSFAGLLPPLPCQSSWGTGNSRLYMYSFSLTLLSCWAFLFHYFQARVPCGAPHGAPSSGFSFLLLLSLFSHLLSYSPFFFLFAHRHVCRDDCHTVRVHVWVCVCVCLLVCEPLKKTASLAASGTPSIVARQRFFFSLPFQVRHALTHYWCVHIRNPHPANHHFPAGGARFSGYSRSVSRGLFFSVLRAGLLPPILPPYAHTQRLDSRVFNCADSWCHAFHRSAQPCRAHLRLRTGATV
jgi:hypothetical protein